MGTARHSRIDDLLDAAEERGTCLVPHEERDRRAIRRRFRKRDCHRIFSCQKMSFLIYWT